MSNFPLVTAPMNYAVEATAYFGVANIPDSEIGNTVQFAIDIDLGDLIEGDIETLNDMVENRLFTEGGILTDIIYAISEKNPDDGTVRLNVTAQIDFY